MVTFYIGLLIFLILVALIFIWLKRAGVIKTEAEREVELPLNYHDAFNKCLEVLESMKADIKEQDSSAGYIKSILTSFKDRLLWGGGVSGLGNLEVEIKLTKVSEDKTKLNVSSKPFWIAKYIMVVDWGRNSKVVEQIVDRLS